MDRIKNITKIIINILCILLFIILALVVYAKVVVTVSDDIHANYFGYRVLEVASGSMQPTLDLNDVLLVKVNEQDLKVNDIIAYKTEDSIVTHRIIMIDNDNLIVKGDANNTVDSPIKRDQVIGKIVKVFPHLGIWKKVLTEPKILILIFFTLLLFDAALSYNGKEKKEDKKKKVNNSKKKHIEEKVHEEVKKEEVKVVTKPKKEVKPKVETKPKNKPKTTKKKTTPKKVNIEKKELEINKVTKQEENKEGLSISKQELLKNIDKLMKQDEDLSNVKVKRKQEKEDNKETEYTIRLDLNEIQNKINKSVK